MTDRVTPGTTARTTPLILPEARWRHREGLDRLLDALDADRAATRFVGGFVRDSLLGLDPKDIDLATTLAPEDSFDRIRDAGFRAVPTGLAHGTVTAVLPSGPVEVTTLRRDVSTDGRRATVAFTDDWREDAARRDFTINALSAHPYSGQLFDYFEGLADLDAGRVRFIGDPLQRIAEDHLRILRFFRFHARFGWGGPDQAALDACTARANDLMALSRERIADELIKLLAIENPVSTVFLMHERGIFTPVVPEIGWPELATLDRLCERNEPAMPRRAIDPLRRLAALMPPAAEAATMIAQRLKLSKAATKRLAIAADRDLPDDEPPVALAYRLGEQGAIDRLLLSSRPIDRIRRDIAAIEAWVRPDFPIGGGDLIAMGLAPGPIVAATLQQVEKRWIIEGFPPPGRLRAIAEEEVARAG